MGTERTVPARVGNYEILRELASGGMGIVYLARQAELEREVVLKALRPADRDDPARAERLRREGRAAAGVHHQNVVAVHDCFYWRGRPYLVQEYVDGEDLESILRRQGRLPWRIAALVGLALARGLEEIHAQGVLHRDLKPANVLVSRQGEVKIADFGIAYDAVGPALTQTGFAMGTPAYMAPEQIRGETLDERSDLFAWGIVLYQLLTGELPFREPAVDGERSLLARIEKGRFESARRRVRTMPRWLDALVSRCLQPKTKHRPAHATELRRQIERRLKAPPPADARAEITAALGFSARPGTDEAPTALVPRNERSWSVRRLSPPRWPARRTWIRAALALALALAQTSGATRPDSSRPKAAELAIDARPWAWVRLDDGPRLRTPISPGLRLDPGVHLVIFEHPRYGRVVREVQLRGGERRELRQRWTPASLEEPARE